MSTLTIENVGPVQSLAIECPEDGGLVVLRGRNGAGKSITLEAVESLAQGKGAVPVRDGQRTGSVNGFGATITVARSTRRSGELEVESLGAKLDVSVLVDPQIKSPEAADAKRIKALVQLANVLPSAELFYDLVGGREQFEQVIGTAALASDDLVQMADRVKRDLEAAARKAESQAEHAEGRARGAREAAAGVDVAAECDASKVQADLEQAIRVEADLKAKLNSAAKAQRAAREARDRIDDAEAAYKGPTLAACQSAEAAAKDEAESAEKAVREAEEALHRAQANHHAARQTYSHAIAARKQAEAHEEMIAQCREQLAATVPTAPSPEMLQHAAEQVTKARQAIEQAAVIRRAKEQLEQAARHAESAKYHREEAGRLRDAAHGTDEVLSAVVARSGTALRVEAGRLVLDTHRGATYFADLSHGERWKLALDIAIDAIPVEQKGRGLLTIPQEAFDSLDIVAKTMIHDHLRIRRVVGITASASEDEQIRAEVFNG